ncbi:aquaporin AQPAe.a-like isoform X4 [Amphibalanus amphitrite]|uniref:aquaporin AQPAe.a-like isoform X3 n=1 Tax=Amphibalanus amphitrite TaxID=1232801 RepID=UPI001C90D8B9|nr:aquaporin AQPAe.a-like isoform X3 [Amphibalanus amphitrite]XP_043197129.1 aquaporin AQPAe.a-like isoform X4 [Amphibalanus amphitrite]
MPAWSTAREALGLQEVIANKDLWKALLAEFVGTLFLVFLGCLTTIGWQDEGYAPSMVQIAIGFGITVATMAQSIGHISGCHINPAVTVAMFVTRNIPLFRAVCYIVMQCLGGTAGSALLKALTPEGIQGSLGMTQVHPELTAAQGFGIEVLITFVLVFVVFGVCDEKRTDVLGAGPLAIGLAVTTCHVGALKCTGASMNPARSFGPAVVTGIWANHWVFWAGPLLGGLLAAVLYSVAFRADRLGSPRSTGDESKPEKYEP